MIRLVDLSQDIYEGMQVYPGHLKSVTFQHATHPETAPRTTSGFSFPTWGFMLNDIGPTHVDSFRHLDPEPGAESIDQIAFELFYGPATCHDVSRAAPRTDRETADLDRALAVWGMVLNLGDMHFFYTGDRNGHAGANAYLTDFPDLSVSAAEWIVDHGVTTFSVDAPTPDDQVSTVNLIHMMCPRVHLTHHENLVPTGA